MIKPHQNAKGEKDLAVFESLRLKNAFSVKKFKKYLILLYEANFSQILYNHFILKKKGSFNPWSSHTCWSSPEPPPSQPAKHVSCFPHILGHCKHCTTAYMWRFLAVTRGLGGGGGALQDVQEHNFIGSSKMFKPKMLSCVWSLCSVNKLLRLWHFVSALPYNFGSDRENALQGHSKIFAILHRGTKRAILTKVNKLLGV